MWDVATGKEYRKLIGHKSSVISLAFAGDGRRLVSGGDDGTVRIWEVDGGKEVRQLLGHEGGVYGLAACAGWTADCHRRHGNRRSLVGSDEVIVSA